MKTKDRRKKKTCRNLSLGVLRINIGIKYFPQIISKLQNQVWYAYETAEEREQGGRGNASKYFHHVGVQEELLLASKKLKGFWAN